MRSDRAAVSSAPLLGGGPKLVWPSDAQPDTQVNRAKFLLADARAFYSVEYWANDALTVVIRVLPR